MVNFRLKVYLSPDDPGINYELNNSYIVGRNKDCGIRILSNIVSSEHFTLILMPKTKSDTSHYYVIRDGVFSGNPSRNGTWLNGKIITEITRLKHQDVISFGQLYPQAVFWELEAEQEQHGTFPTERE